MKRILSIGALLMFLMLVGCEGDYTIQNPGEVVRIEVPVEVLVEVPVRGGTFGLTHSSSHIHLME